MRNKVLELELDFGFWILQQHHLSLPRKKPARRCRLPETRKEAYRLLVGLPPAVPLERDNSTPWVRLEMTLFL